MSVSFSNVPANNPSLMGRPAAPKQFFGPRNRYAVAPIHTLDVALEWFVWDAEHKHANLSRAAVIRQADSLEEAMQGLPQDDEETE